MVGVDVGGWVDLEAVVVVVGVLEEAVHWVEDFVRQGKEPFSVVGWCCCWWNGVVVGGMVIWCCCWW